MKTADAPVEIARYYMTSSSDIEPLLLDALVSTATAMRRVPPAARVAWECPRCHVIHAPHVDRCECTP